MFDCLDEKWVVLLCVFEFNLQFKLRLKWMQFSKQSTKNNENLILRIQIEDNEANQFLDQILFELTFRIERHFW